jgi:hypothetical protein
MLTQTPASLLGASQASVFVHLTDTARGFGGFYEQLLDLG